MMPPLLLLSLSLLLSLLSTNAAVSAFVARHPAAKEIVIVGKIILDKYGPPNNNNNNDNNNSQKDDNNDDSRGITIGGGGPQAAWGAAASLAARDYLLQKKIYDGGDEDYNRIIKHQKITFLAPIGTKNWTPSMTEQISQLLPPMVKVVLIPSADHITPTINIWHDEHENVRWMPVDGSFDDVGANGLWQNRPSAQDILTAILQEEDDGSNNSNDIILHAIIESGSKPTGEGLDALPFLDNELMSRVSSAGVEPIVFADDVSGKVTYEDSYAVTTTINKIRQSFICAHRAYSSRTFDEVKNDGNNNKSLFVVTPDRPCYEGMISHTNFTISEGNTEEGNEFFETIIRDGGNGCFTNNNEMKMPAATLRTVDGMPVNPTGAGNAFSAAYVVCRGTGSSRKEAASLATAVGAVVCEYPHLPPWSSEVLERIVEGACEVNEKCTTKPSTSLL